jgi:predicted nucleotidyltransferase
MAPGLRERVQSFFGADPHGVVAVYIFGSTARGDDTVRSDIDIAVLFDTPPDPTLAGPRLTLEGELERVLGRPVDLIDLGSAPADLVHRVLRDGDVVVDLDRARRLRFEVARRNEYFDLEPVRRQYRRRHSVAGPAR